MDVKTYLYKNYLERQKLNIIDNLLELDLNFIICPYLINKLKSIKCLSNDVEKFGDELNDFINYLGVKIDVDTGINSNDLTKILELEEKEKFLCREKKLERICE